MTARLARRSTARRATLLTAAVCLGACLGACTTGAPPQAPAQPPMPVSERTVVVYAAGSLRGALDAVAKAFEQAHPAKVAMTYGASGLLKDRILAGAAPQLFASANMDHPQAVVAAGKAVAVAPFARNALCVLATPAFTLQGKPLALRLLDADVRLATSTPKADPAGDYAFTMFDRIESSGAAGAGSAAALKAKALQLTGGPNSAPPPPGRNVYGVLVAANQADAFVTYCTNAAQAKREVPTLQVLPVPDAINVSAVYGMAAMNGASADGRAWAQFVLGPQGQAILASHGFSAP
jgi:molybdate transport system substrate-binding protein